MLRMVFQAWAHKDHLVKNIFGIKHQHGGILFPQVYSKILTCSVVAFSLIFYKRLLFDFCICSHFVVNFVVRLLFL